jgi:hypothetical protein
MFKFSQNGGWNRAQGMFAYFGLIKHLSISLPISRLFAVFESANEGSKSWQMMVQLFANNPDQMMPFSTMWNITKGEKWIKADEMAECQSISNGAKRIQLEVGEK